MGPSGIFVENEAPKDTANPHHQIRAIPHPEDRSPQGWERAGCEDAGGRRGGPERCRSLGTPRPLPAGSVGPLRHVKDARPA